MLIKRNFIYLVIILPMLIACTEQKKQYWHNGNLKSELNYENGKLNGKANWYYKNKQKEQEAFYYNNQLHGEMTRWYPNGQLELIAYYKHGKLEGTFLIYTIDGNKDTEENYLNDTLEGVFLKYHSNGTFKIQGQYHKGLFTGQWIYHDIFGNIIGVGNFENGNGLQKAWYPNGNLQREISYKNNLKDGNERWFNAQGELEKEIKYLGGKLVE